jgi:hypothetical protein
MISIRIIICPFSIPDVLSNSFGANIAVSRTPKDLKRYALSATAN